MDDAKCNLKSILTVLKRIEITKAEGEVEEKLVQIKGRKQDKAPMVKSFVVSQSSLSKACARHFNNIQGNIYAVLISNDVDATYIQTVAKPGIDLAVSGQVYLSRSPFDKHVTSIFYYTRGLQNNRCVVIDAGANIGATITLPALSMGCQVFSFELQLKLRSWIKVAASLNNFEEEQLILNGPISTEAKNICYTPNNKHFAGLQTSDQENSHQSSRDKQLSKTEKSCAKTRRLDSVLNENHVQEVTFMKLDVDGPDLDVLRSLGKFLRSGAIKNFVFERLFDGQREIHGLLNSYGYSCMDLCFHGEYSIKEYQDLMIGYSNSLKGKNKVPPCRFSRDVWCWKEL